MVNGDTLTVKTGLGGDTVQLTQAQEAEARALAQASLEKGGSSVVFLGREAEVRARGQFLVNQAQRKAFALGSERFIQQEGSRRGQSIDPGSPLAAELRREFGRNLQLSASQLQNVQGLRGSADPIVRAEVGVQNLVGGGVGTQEGLFQPDPAGTFVFGGQRFTQVGTVEQTPSFSPISPVTGPTETLILPLLGGRQETQTLSSEPAQRLGSGIIGAPPGTPVGTGIGGGTLVSIGGGQAVEQPFTAAPIDDFFTPAQPQPIIPTDPTTTIVEPTSFTPAGAIGQTPEGGFIVARGSGFPEETVGAPQVTTFGVAPGSFAEFNIDRAFLGDLRNRAGVEEPINFSFQPITGERAGFPGGEEQFRTELRAHFGEEGRQRLRSAGLGAAFTISEFGFQDISQREPLPADAPLFQRFLTPFGTRPVPEDVDEEAFTAGEILGGFGVGAGVARVRPGTFIAQPTFGRATVVEIPTGGTGRTLVNTFERGEVLSDINLDAPLRPVTRTSITTFAETPRGAFQIGRGQVATETTVIDISPFGRVSARPGFIVQSETLPIGEPFRTFSGDVGLGKVDTLTPGRPFTREAVLAQRVGRTDEGIEVFRGVVGPRRQETGFALVRRGRDVPERGFEFGLEPRAGEQPTRLIETFPEFRTRLIIEDPSRFRGIRLPEPDLSDVGTTIVGRGTGAGRPTVTTDLAQATDFTAGSTALAGTRATRVASARLIPDRLGGVFAGPGAFAGTGLFERTDFRGGLTLPTTRDTFTPFDAVPLGRTTQFPRLIDLSRGDTRPRVSISPLQAPVTGVTSIQTPLQPQVPITGQPTALGTGGQLDLPEFTFTPVDFGFGFRGGRTFRGFPPALLGLPGAGGGRKPRKRKGKRQRFRRTPSFAALQLGLEAPGPVAGEITGLVERPIIRRRRKRK